VIYLISGIIIGIVMGLTGAGGALVAIPLFIHFMGMNLKEASVYSLIAVVVASLVNFVAQRKETQYQTGLVIVCVSAFTSFITAPYKEFFPTLYVAILLALVSVYSLYIVWVPVKVTSEESHVPQTNVVLSVAVGIVLGALTTFTGLGGGVLMLPIFMAFFHYSHPQSVATSLFAVGLSSLASLFIQMNRGPSFNVKIDLLFLIGGILISVFILKQLLRPMSQKAVSRTRQVVFTLVVLLALVKIF
jgi:uncharacterized membrane protein YfcA